MERIRVIPILLLKGRGLYKGVKFDKYKYVGDPLNAVKIFNEKEVDELAIFDIEKSAQNKEPNFDLIKDIACECFMPITYGGGVSKVEHISKLMRAGVEKIMINTNAHINHDFIRQAVKDFGSTTIVCCIDVKHSRWGGTNVYLKSGKQKTKLKPIDAAKQLEDLGIGELIVNSISNDGTFVGYDLDLIKDISSAVNIPVIAAGGAGKFQDFIDAKKAGADALAAGSHFVFVGKHRAVLINYLSKEEIELLNNA